MAQLVRAPPCHGGGREFESLLGRFLWGLSSAGRASALQAEGHRFEPYRPHFLNKISRSGGTGRRPGLKIPWVVIPVPVRFRSAALKKTLNSQGFFVWKCKFQPIFVYGDACVSRHERLVKKHIIDSLENL